MFQSLQSLQSLQVQGHSRLKNTPSTSTNNSNTTRRGPTMIQKINEFCEAYERFISLSILVVIIMGVTLTLTAFLLPGDPTYVIDPSLSAKENEEREMQHMRLINVLHIVSCIGMGLLTIGAITTSVLLMRVIATDENFMPCCRCKKKDEEQDLTQQLRQQRQIQQQQLQRQQYGQHQHQQRHTQKFIKEQKRQQPTQQKQLPPPPPPPQHQQQQVYRPQDCDHHLSDQEHPSACATPERVQKWAVTPRKDSDRTKSAKEKDSDKTKLVNADHMELNREFSQKKAYGSVGYYQPVVPDES